MKTFRFKMRRNEPLTAGASPRPHEAPPRLREASPRPREAPQRPNEAVPMLFEASPRAREDKGKRALSPTADSGACKLQRLFGLTEMQSRSGGYYGGNAMQPQDELQTPSGSLVRRVGGEENDLDDGKDIDDLDDDDARKDLDDDDGRKDLDDPDDDDDRKDLDDPDDDDDRKDLDDHSDMEDGGIEDFTDYFWRQASPVLLTRRVKHDIDMMVEKIWLMGMLTTVRNFFHQWSEMHAGKEEVGINMRDAVGRMQNKILFESDGGPSGSVLFFGEIAHGLEEPLRHFMLQDKIVDDALRGEILFTRKRDVLLHQESLILAMNKRKHILNEETQREVCETFEDTALAFREYIKSILCILKKDALMGIENDRYLHPDMKAYKQNLVEMKKKVEVKDEEDYKRIIKEATSYFKKGAGYLSTNDHNLCNPRLC